jgi:hypothetical protein
MLKRGSKDRRREPNLGGRPAMTYYRSGPPTDSPSPFKKADAPRRKRQWTGRLLDWCIVVAVIALAIYGLSLDAKPDVEVDSDTYRPGLAYKQAAAEAMNGLKYRTKLTFDEKALSDKLKRKYPEISSVSADLSLFSRTPKLHIAVAQPSLVFEGTAGTFGANQHMIVDAKGTVVGPASDFASIRGLPSIRDDTGFGARTGESALSRSDVDFILTIIAQAKKAKLPIKSLTFPRSAQELDLRTADRPYYVKFYLSGDPLLQSGQFLAARHQFDQQNKQPKQYLDVRVSGKIFYK